MWAYFYWLKKTNKQKLSQPFDPQDNGFVLWAHSYAAFHNWCNCWVGGVLSPWSVEIFLWCASPLQGKDFLQLCEYFWHQSYVMPLLYLMISKMDLCNTLYFNYGHNLTFNFDYRLLGLMTISLHIRQIGLDLIFSFLTWHVSNMEWGHMTNSWNRTSNIYCPYMLGTNRALPKR